jgi:ribosome-binding factor A
VGERIQDELARLIREEVRDPRVGFVTLTGVDLSHDLRHAKVYVSVLGDDMDETLRALGHATPFLKRELGRRAGLKHTPSLRFLEDRSIRGAQRIENLLDEIADKHDRRGGGGD